MKILLTGPTHFCKEYCMLEWMKATTAIREHNKNTDFDITILLVDNSPDNEKGNNFSSRMTVMCEEYDIVYKRLLIEEDQKAPVHKRISDSMNYSLDYLLENDFEYLYILEVDVLPTPNSLNHMYQYMINNDVKAIQGAYYVGYTPEAFEKEKFWLTGINLIHSDVFKNYGIRFRYDHELLAALSDAFLGHDMHSNNIKTAFHPNVRAVHYHAPDGHRGWNKL